MRSSFQNLSDASMAKLAVATCVTPPKEMKAAPVLWGYFSDSVACEIARRRGLGDIEPSMPNIPPAELEAGAQFLAVIAPVADDEGTTELHDALIQIANAFLTLRRLTGDEHAAAH